MIKYIPIVAVLGVLFAIVAIVKFKDLRVKKRLLAARCPGCGEPFPPAACQNPQIHARVSVTDQGSHTEVGFALPCAHCKGDFVATADGIVRDRIKTDTTGQPTSAGDVDARAAPEK